MVEPADVAHSPPEPTLAALLQSVPEFSTGTDLAAFVTGLVADANLLDKNGRDALVNANVRRFRIGQAWAASVPKKRSDREAWMRVQGEAHDLGLTRVRQIVRAAVALDKALSTVSADRLPIAVLDRKLEAIPTAVRAVLDGRAPDQRATRRPRTMPSTPGQRLQVFAERVTKVIKAIFSGHEAEVPAALKALAKSGTTVADPTRRLASPTKVHDEEPRLGPVMQYAGGKTYVAPFLAEVLGRLPPDAELREPFCGGASVSVHMLLTGRATKVWLNDLDPVVQAMWNAVIHEPDDLCRALEAIVHSPANYKEMQKAVNKGDLSGVELAAATIYVQKMSFNSGYKAALKDGQNWNPAVSVTRAREIHELLCGRVVHGRCTGLDALEVIRAPGNAVLFLDPPYWGVKNGFYRKFYGKKAQFHALAEALRYPHDGPNHPWVMTIGDDEVANEMVIPGARVHRIRSGVRWQKITGRMSGGAGGDGWLLDLNREDPPKRELLITSDAWSERWGLPGPDAEVWERWFGDQGEADQTVADTTEG